MGPAEVISADTEGVVWQGETSQVPVGWALAWLTSKVVCPRTGTATCTAWGCPLVYSSFFVAGVAVVPKLARIKYSLSPLPQYPSSKHQPHPRPHAHTNPP